MPGSNTKKLAACAAAVAAIALLITPASAQARPKNECYDQAGYQFPGGPMVIVYPETDAETRFDAPLGTTIDVPAETFYQNGTSLTGRVTGDMAAGGNVINLTVTRERRDPLPPLLLSGAVQPNNTAAGAFSADTLDGQLWESPTQLPCIPGAPPAPASLPITRVTVNSDCDVFADNAVTGTIVGKLNGYSSPDGVTDVPKFFGCQGKYCEIEFAAGPNGRAWVYDGFIDEPYESVG
jgi:hypothetical protein